MTGQMWHQWDIPNATRLHNELKRIDNDDGYKDLKDLSLYIYILLYIYIYRISLGKDLWILILFLTLNTSWCALWPNHCPACVPVRLISWTGLQAPLIWFCPAPTAHFGLSLAGLLFGLVLANGAEPASKSWADLK